MKHLRILHFLLKDKKNYHKDEELARNWEIYKYHLNYLKTLSYFLLKKKILYFVEHKKVFLIKNISLLVALIGIMFISGKYIIENNSYFEVKRIVERIQVDTIYVPDTITVNDYAKRIAIVSKLSVNEVKTKIFFTVFYSKDTLKTAEKWLKLLAQIESKNNKNAINGQYWGMWQMGQEARNSVGFGGVSKKEYLNSYEVQRASVIIYLKNNYKTLKPYLNKYDNKMINGYHLTTSGLLAMSHNTGPQGVIDFLNSRCSYIPRDGNNFAATEYLKLGNYNVYELLQDH